MRLSDILEKSIIVSAHPDDEVLWFSSILDKADEVIICFLDVKSKADRSTGRRKTISEYPVKKVSCLGIPESEAFNGANWHNPVLTKFGIEIGKKGVSRNQYIENYYELKKSLKNKLIGYINVFTHNPWGEYGSEDHIQVYRVVKELQEEIKYDLWFSNYCSNKSINLMSKYINSIDSGYVTVRTNKTLAHYIKNLYKTNGCWTWYDDWEWFNEESFLKDKSYEKKNDGYGHIFPLNMIKVEAPVKSEGMSAFFRKFTAKILRNQNTKWSLRAPDGNPHIHRQSEKEEQILSALCGKWLVIGETKQGNNF